MTTVAVTSTRRSAPVGWTNVIVVVAVGWTNVTAVVAIGGVYSVVVLSKLRGMDPMAVGLGA